MTIDEIEALIWVFVVLVFAVVLVFLFSDDVWRR